MTSRDSRAQVLPEALEARRLLAVTHVTVSDCSYDEGDSAGGAVFVVTRDGDLSGNLAVTYDTMDGTAVAGIDYTAKSGTIQFAAGQSAAQVVVPVIDNTLYQSDRTFTLGVTIPSFSTGATFNWAYWATTATGDFNGDGRSDIAGLYPSIPDGTYVVSIVLGSSDGGFSEHSLSFPVNAWTAPDRIVTGDYTGDGNVDILTNYYDGIQLMAGNGDGTFHTPVIIVSGIGYQGGLVATDMNEDGMLDLVASSGGARQVAVYYGAGDGTLRLHESVFSGGIQDDIDVVDLNGDGRKDFVMTYSNSSRMGYLLADPAGGYKPLAEIFDVTGALIDNSVTTGDYNGDGLVDLAVDGDSVVNILLASGDGTYGAPVSFGVGASVRAIDQADFDGNGRLDLAVATTQGVLVLYNQPDAHGLFHARRPNLVSAERVDLAVGDFDGDSRADVVAAISYSDLPAYNPGKAVVLLNQRAESVEIMRLGATGTIIDNDTPVSMGIAIGCAASATVQTGQRLDSMLGVVVRNSRGQGVGNVQVSFEVPSGGASGVFGGSGASAVVTTTATGIGDAPAFTANTIEGAYTVAASIAGPGVAPVTFSLRNSAGYAEFSAVDYFPLIVPATWTYEGTQSTNSAQDLSVRVHRRSLGRVVDGSPATEFVESASATENSGGVLGTLIRDYSFDAQNGIRILRQDNQGTILSFSKSPIVFLPASFHVGQHSGWSGTAITVTSGTQTLEGQSSGTTIIEAMELLELPGGLGQVYAAKVVFDHTEVYTFEDETTTVHEIETAMLVRGIGIAADDASVRVDEAFVDEGTQTSTVTASHSLTGYDFDPLASGSSQLLGASATGAGSINVALRNQTGSPVMLRKNGGAWTATYLQDVTGCPDITGEVVTWVGPTDGLTYAAAMTDRGLALFTNWQDDQWTFRNLGSEVDAFVPLITGNLTTFTSTDNIVSLAGVAANGDLVRYYQTAPGSYTWAAINHGDDLRAQGLAAPRFAGRITSFVTSWNALNVVGLDADGQIQAVWWHQSLNTGGKWTTNNLSALTGAPALNGGLTVWLTGWDAINIAGADVHGNLSTTWWVAASGGGDQQWRTMDMTALIGGPQLQAGSITSWVTPWNAMNIVGREADGTMSAYWWVPNYNDNNWQVAKLTGSGATTTIGPITAITALGGDFSMNIFGTSATGEMIREWWSPSTNAWAEQNLTRSAIVA